jgi:hypothetical protein
MLCLIRRNRRGSASIVGAFFLLSFVAAATMATQLATIYVVKLQVQRTADIANLAALIGASPIIGNAASPAAISTAQNMATLNGYPSGSVSVSGAEAGSQAFTLSTKISATPIYAIGLVGTPGPSSVSASSVATLTRATYSDCLASLTGAVQITGTASLSGSSCGLGAATYLYVAGGSMSLASAAVGDDAYSEMSELTSAGSLQPAASAVVFNAATTDTLAANTDILAIENHLSAMAAWPYATSLPIKPSSPSVPSGSDVSFSGSSFTLARTTSYGTLLASNATLNFSGSGSADPQCGSPTTISGNVTLSGTNTLNFASGCYIFGGDVRISSGSTSFATGTATVTLIFEGQFGNNSPSDQTLGNATYSFDGNISTTSGGAITVGTGTKAFGGNINSVWGHIIFGDGTSYLNGTSIITSTGTTQFGNGAFYLWNGLIWNPSWGTTKFGTGPFFFYNSSLFNSIGGIGYLSFGGGPYYFYNSSLTSGAYGVTGGATIFGAGNLDFYAGGGITSYNNLTFQNSGSNATGGALISLHGGSINAYSGLLSASGTTFALTSGTFNVSGPIEAAAPTGESPTYGYQNLLLVSTEGNVSLANSSASLSGMIYAPAGTVTMSGTETVSVNGGSCFGAAAQSITLSDSVSVAVAPCAGLMPISSAASDTLTQ